MNGLEIGIYIYSLPIYEKKLEAYYYQNHTTTEQITPNTTINNNPQAPKPYTIPIYTHKNPTLTYNQKLLNQNQI